MTESPDELLSACWPESALDQAIDALVAHTGLRRNSAWETAGPSTLSAAATERIEHRASQAGCEAIAVTTSFSELESTLQHAVPALVQLLDSAYLAIVRNRGRYLIALAPTGEILSLPRRAIVQQLRAKYEDDKRTEFESLLTNAGLTGTAWRKATEALLDEHLGSKPVAGLWHLRPPIGATNLPQFLSAAGLHRLAAYLVGAHLCEYLLWLAAWAVMGQLSFSGRLDAGWLAGWALLLLTTVPFRIATTWLQGVAAISLGAALKQRLLAGALQLDRESIRRMGVGAFLGQALESEAVETLALGGAIVGALALVELILAGAVLGYMSILLVAWCILLAASAMHFRKQYERWTGARMEMTEQLVENMAGHRTRLAQQSPADWHGGEAAALSDYILRSQGIDGSGKWLVAAIPRGWLIAGLLWLIPSAISGASAGPTLAIRLGGVLLAFTALRKLSDSAVEIMAAITAAGRVAPLFNAAQQVEKPGQLLGRQLNPKPAERLLEADHVSYRYKPTGAPALHATNVVIRRGEKILIEGSSGGGKTTFASLLSGLRSPASGLLLLHGLDSHTVGSKSWRKRVASAPQFHENYILTETLAFNLLLGRQWPPTQADLAEAEGLCRELGLGDLLDRMPGGIEQMVGEGGWQLSHGERSRIYVARALLQNADIVVLDESFGALDPENLTTALECTVKRAETLLVVAHP